MTLHLRSLDLQPPDRSVIRKSSGTRSVYADRLKRLFDLVVVLISLPVIVPLLLLLILLVARDGHSPIYRQSRIGRGGRVYRIVKLRTMVPDADSLLAQHLAADPVARSEWNDRQKLSRDPRITRVGHFLRKSSLDEFPQLWNVLKGDMSLVGPRPMMVDQQKLYPGEAYYLLRPGITGPWQVSSRNHSTFVERATFDDAYHRKVTFGNDLAILWKTVEVVLRGTGC